MRKTRFLTVYVLMFVFISLCANGAWDDVKVNGSPTSDDIVSFSGIGNSIEASGVSKQAMLNTIATMYSNDRMLLVTPQDTETGNWASLTNKYEAAKALTPGGNALSATNRAIVVLPPGIYDAGTNTLSLVDYVDIQAMYPEVLMDHHRDYTLSHDNLIYFGWANGYDFLFPKTRIQGAPPVGGAIILQTNENVRLTGFSIECEYDGTSTNGQQIGFYCTAPEGGQDSRYEKMTFYADTNFRTVTTQHRYHFDGEWVDCVGRDFTFRLENINTGVDYSQEFRATMINCHAGIRSFGGDSPDGIIKGAYLERCTSPGGAFGGCTYEAIGNDSATVFIECEALPFGRSFGLGDICAGTLIRCRGGQLCGGATTSDGQVGIFTGHAIDCQFGAGSLGGRGVTEVGTPESTDAYCAGTIDKCTITDNVLSTHLLGAQIRDSYYTQGDSVYTNYTYAEIVGGVTNQVLTLDEYYDGVEPPWYYLGSNTYPAATDMFRILDTNSIILDSVIEVNSAGTGTAVTATSPLSVVFFGNTFNNIDVNADGVSSNVTKSSGAGGWGTDFANNTNSAANAIMKDGSVAMTGPFNAGGQNLINISSRNASFTAGGDVNSLKLDKNLELSTGTILATGSTIAIQDSIQVSGAITATAGFTLGNGYLFNINNGYMTDSTSSSALTMTPSGLSMLAGDISLGDNDVTDVSSITFTNGAVISKGTDANALKISKNLELSTGTIYSSGATVAIQDSIQVSGAITATAGFTLGSGYLLNLNDGYITDSGTTTAIGMTTNGLEVVSGDLLMRSNDVLQVSSIVFTNGWSIQCTTNGLEFVAP